MQGIAPLTYNLVDILQSQETQEVEVTYVNIGSTPPPSITPTSSGPTSGSHVLTKEEHLFSKLTILITTNLEEIVKKINVEGHFHSKDMGNLS